MTKLAFCDTETTGLDPDLHEIYEVGLIVREENGEEHEHHWWLPVDLGMADARALAVGRFHERYPGPKELIRRFEFGDEFSALTRGAHLVGAVISFDEERLRRLLRSNGACPEWHYHLVDVEALAAGSLAGMNSELGDLLASSPDMFTPPWDSEALSRAVGVDPDQFDRHTALGDARWAMAIYDAVMGTEGAP